MGSLQNVSGSYIGVRSGANYNPEQDDPLLRLSIDPHRIISPDPDELRQTLALLPPEDMQRFNAFLRTIDGESIERTSPESSISKPKRKKTAYWKISFILIIPLFAYLVHRFTLWSMKTCCLTKEEIQIIEE